MHTWLEEAGVYAKLKRPGRSHAAVQPALGAGPGYRGRGRALLS